MFYTFFLLDNYVVFFIQQFLLEKHEVFKFAISITSFHPYQISLNNVCMKSTRCVRLYLGLCMTEISCEGGFFLRISRSAIRRPVNRRPRTSANTSPAPPYSPLLSPGCPEGRKAIWRKATGMYPNGISQSIYRKNPVKQKKFKSSL